MVRSSVAPVRSLSAIPFPFRKDVLFDLRKVPWIDLAVRIKPEPRFYGFSPFDEF
jgi:hypothetical protein